MTATREGSTLTSTLPEQAVAVTGRRVLSDRVVELELTTVDASSLVWGPGAHIDLLLPSGLVRQYSLCGGSPDGTTVRIAVLREADGRGGSAEVHDALSVGTTLAVRGPRNHFRLVEAANYVFIAGGIGVTPILPMIRRVSGTGATWRLLYGGRNRTTMAYVPELQDLQAASQQSARLDLVPEDEFGLLDLKGALSDLPEGTVVYACGPEPLLKALEDVAGELLTPGQLHLERFGAADRGDEGPADGALDEFEVEIASTGEVLKVGPDDRMIDVVRQVFPQVPFSCEEGYCGSCETGVLSGLPCHRDQVLTDEERATNATMMICVGRSLSTRITLDL